MTARLTYSSRKLKLLIMVAMLLTLTTTTLMVSVIMTQWQNSNGCIHLDNPTAFWKCGSLVAGEVSSRMSFVRNLSDTSGSKTSNSTRELSEEKIGQLSEEEVVAQLEASKRIKYDPLQDMPKTHPRIRKENISVANEKEQFPANINSSVGLFQQTTSTAKLTGSSPKPTVRAFTNPPLNLRNDSKIFGILGDQPVPSEFAWKADMTIEKCKSSGPILLILIHSARENFERRSIIRETWGSVKLYRSWRIITIFLLGAKDASENPDVLKSMAHEYYFRGDIVKKSTFIDSYRNMTEKHFMGYEWASTYCPQASFVIKSDDDIMIDVFKFIDWVTTRVRGDRNAYYCRVLGSHYRPHRDPSSKWYVSMAEYSKQVFPKFCSGGAYATSMNVVKMVIRVLKRVPRLWLDDVYITGLGVEQVNKILVSKGQNQSLIVHQDRSEEYIYHHWERRTGMALIRDWCQSNLNYSPWTFLLVEHGPRYLSDCKQVWDKICAIHDQSPKAGTTF